MTDNEIKCAIEDAWKEFELTGEITNAADNLLYAVLKINAENARLKRLIDNHDNDLSLQFTSQKQKQKQKQKHNTI